MALLDEWKEKQPPELAKPEKKTSSTSDRHPASDTLFREVRALALGMELCGDISPVAGVYAAQPGVGRQGGGTPAAFCGGLPLRSARLCYFPGKRRGYILRAAPFPWIGKGGGIGLTPYLLYIEKKRRF